ncbi:MULTIHEME_CYTC domain-containing protein [Rubrivivax sp. A210]|uniref:cytochrome c3 family protein n=1 Tax=Rubrivivax sp. A210 TaxID=2772301 RepID=UPI00198513A4|nr:cytochrome c3 family protein [Rubrivivax sp. A210]CAD5372783.1 MULTIHEME_CYTC domain-containing protein [Rubrivivax sp. A210]
MKKRPVLLIVIALNLVVLVALAFAYPHLMVSPGPLVKGHAELATDCFACHAVWRGASSGRCVECHAVADVGLRTTKGVAIAAGTIKVSFHQALIEQDCMACHSDHQGPKLTKRSRKPFSHELLKATVRDGCSSCHAAPKDTVHRDLKVECSQCHESKAWKPAHFDHALLAKAALDQCQSCHNAPTDRLHRQIRGSCKACHKTEAWKPATFDHDKYFVLDRDHEASCETCHKNNDYSRYTCYGCHEHSLANVRAEHLEEGIPNFENCVECHRDPRVEPEKGGGGRGRGERKRD